MKSDSKSPTPFTVSSRSARPLGPYPHARRVGNLLFLSGIGPRHRETEQIPEGIEAQTRACIENVKAILEDAGSSLEKVADVTVFLTNIDRDFAAFNRVYGEFFEKLQTRPSQQERLSELWRSRSRARSS